MTDSGTTLASTVADIEAKASDYSAATDYENTLDNAKSELDSIESSLQRLERRVESMEFYAAVLTDVFGEEAPLRVEESRRSVRSVTDYDEDFYYELATDKRSSDYKSQIRQAKSAVSDAESAVESELDGKQDLWFERVNAADNIQRIFGQTREASEILDDIENFVQRKMWDDSNDVSTLETEWQSLRRSWDTVTVDWEGVKQEYGLSDATVGVLQQLAEGERVELGDIDESVARELLSVDELHGTVTLGI